MELWKLVSTYRTGPMRLVGSDSVVHVFRIEVFSLLDGSNMRVEVSKNFHYELKASYGTAETSVATEEIWTTEESFGFDDLRSSDEKALVDRVLAELERVFVAIDD